MSKNKMLPSPEDSKEPLSHLLEEEILASATQRRRDSFARLKAACDALAKKRGELKLADVGREIANQFGADAGPTAQSIANDKAGFRRYVEARERERLASLSAAERKATKGPDSLRQLVEKIDDPDIRSRVIELHDRCTTAERALSRAKFLLANGRGDSPKIEIPDSLRVLIRLISDEASLSKVGLVIEENGRVKRKSGTGDELIPPGVLPALQAYLLKGDM